MRTVPSAATGCLFGMDREGKATVLRELHKLNREPHDELTQILKPMAQILASRIDTDLAEYGDATTAEDYRTTLIHELPHGEQYRRLSPQLFGRVTWMGYKPKTSPAIPTSAAERQQLVNDFRRRSGIGFLSMIATNPFILNTISCPDKATTLQDHSTALQDLHERGITIDSAKWNLLTSAAHQQLRRGAYTLDVMLQGQNHSIDTMMSDQKMRAFVDTYATGQCDTYLAATTEAYDYRYPVGPAFLRTNIGAYGIQVAKDLVLSTLYTINTAGHVLAAPAEAAAKGHETVLMNRTARGADHGRTPGDVLVTSVQEGCRSDKEIKSLLMAELVPGYEDDPRSLYADILAKGLVEEFTRAAPQGLIGPMTLAGRFIPGLVQNLDNGLCLNPKIMHALKEVRFLQQLQTLLYQTNHIVEGINDNDNPKIMGEFGKVCPAVNGPLGVISRAIGRVCMAVEPD